MAIEVTAGNPLVNYFRILDPDKQPMTGVEFTIAAAQRPDGGTFPVSVIEDGGGTYHVYAETKRGDPEGTYYIAVRTSYDDEYDSEFYVTALPSPTIVHRPVEEHGVTRGELRRMIADELGDLRTVVATDAGTVDSVVDTINLAKEAHHFDGMQILCTAGIPANVGLVSTVRSSNQITSSVTFSPALPEATYTGDMFELYNFRGTGWNVAEYNRAINNAIDRVGHIGHFLIPHEVTLPDTYNPASGEVVIPPEFAYFSGMYYKGRSRTAREQMKYTWYKVNKFSRTVSINRQFGSRLHGSAITMFGYVRPQQMFSDTDETSIPAEWLVPHVKGMLTGQDVNTGVTQGARDRTFNFYSQGADGRRMSIIGTRAPNTVRLS